EGRLLQIGSSSTRRPSISSSTLEWPYQVARSPSRAGSGTADTSGTGPRGRRDAKSPSCFTTTVKLGRIGTAAADGGLWNAPSRKFGDRRTRSARGPDGRLPREAGRSRSTAPAAAATAPATSTLRTVRFTAILHPDSSSDSDR